MSTELDTTEASDLAELETVISDGMSSFVRVGLALKGIRDRRLYRMTHPTFEDYCKAKWGWTRQHVNNQIRGTDVVKTLETLVSNPPSQETHVRPLARLTDADEQVEAWRRVIDRAGGEVVNITAKLVREEVAKFLPPKPEKPFDFVRERDAIFAWLIDRLGDWPVEYRDTFAAFVGNIAKDIQEQQRAH